MNKFFAVAALCSGLAACGGSTVADTGSMPELPSGASGYVKEVVSVPAMLAESRTGRVELDLRDTTNGFWVPAGTNYSDIDVICPSERKMNLESWLPELAAEFGTGRDRLERGFIMYSSMKSSGDVGAQAAPACTSPCYLHLEPDRTWVCFC